METEIKLLKVTSNDGKELIPEGDRIIKINRRFQNCLVDLVFERRKIKAWLGYELEEK